MLIKFNDIVSKYSAPKGIIHIGAHKMEEREDYLASNIKNIIWIEANPELVKRNQSLTSPSERVFECAVSDVDNKIYDFNITNNGESSSILDLDLHKIHHPHIHVTETIKVKSKRIDTLIKENSINIKDHDFVNIDIQGAELLALKGFGEYLHSVKYIYTEVNTNYLYKNCCLINEIDEFLSQFNFQRKETLLTQYEWGDALYIKE
tara:strand:+ start:38483 stop:39100 length:618 start_codon:yes stop_codon:yes gene_type:complete